MHSKTYLEHELVRSFTLDKIISIFYSDLNLSFTSYGEQHNFWEFVYVDRGTITVQTDKEFFTLEKGQICFHKPCEFHCHKSFSNDTPSLCIVSFHCGHTLLDTLARRRLSLSLETKTLLSQILKYGTMIFSDIVDTSDEIYLIKKDSYPLYYEQLVLDYLEIFLLEVIHSLQDSDAVSSNLHTYPSTITKNNSKQLVEDVQHYLLENLYSNITIQNICHHLNCSKTTLSVSFKTYTGTSVINYFNRLKIEKAKEMIRTQTLNITQISQTLHFCNIHYFSNLFKKQTGMYPSEYAKSIKAHNCIKLLHIDYTTDM